MLHNVWHLGGHGPLGPPKSALVIFWSLVTDCGFVLRTAFAQQNCEFRQCRVEIVPRLRHRGLTRECRDTRRKTRAAERRYWRTRTDDNKLTWAAELRTLRSLYRRKTDDFWRTEMAASNGNTSKLWRTFQRLFGETCSDETSAHTADDFASFFSRQSRCSPSVYFRYALYDVPFKATKSSLDSWTAVITDEVNKLINASPNKTCQLDPVPTWLVKEKNCWLHLSPCYSTGRLLPDVSHLSLNKPLFVRGWRRAGWMPATWITTDLYPTCHSSPSCWRGWYRGD